MPDLGCATSKKALNTNAPVRPKKGDYVRIVAEGQVTFVYDDGDLEIGGLAANIVTEPEVFRSVEIIDLPFPVGSVVKDKSSPEHTYLLLDSGFVYRNDWSYMRYDDVTPDGHFHSGNYELVG